MGLARWLNLAWMVKCRRELAAFHRATERVAEVQQAKLSRLVWANRDTVFGRQHGFASIRSVADFRARVPLSSYEEMQPWTERIALGQTNVLTGDPVKLLEPTGGSTGGEKLIPYTDSLRREFQHGVSAWIADLFGNRPEVRRGRAYWSISPALGERRTTPGGLPIGFDDDAAYLGRLEQFALAHVLVVPPQLARLTDLAAFRYATLLYLLAADDLSLISIWHPSFLTLLTGALETWGERICHDLRTGIVCPPGAGPETSARLLPRLPRNPRRAAQIDSILRQNADSPSRLKQLWPSLAVISCWADAAAELSLVELQTLFPTVEIQPKGLLATEGFVSFPLVNQPGAALSLRSHFFEFLESESCGSQSSSAGSCRLAHELEQGGRYRVVLSTSGGLYRYQLHDEVAVVGHLRGCPLLRFVGKTDRTSDLVGEKLSEAHVRTALDSLLTERRVRPTFALLAPVAACPPHYRLFLQLGTDATDQVSIARWRYDLNEHLQRNPYYRHAVGLSQLAPADVCLLPADATPTLAYERHRAAQGQRIGNIKPAVLDTWTGWTELLCPRENSSSPRAFDGKSAVSPASPTEFPRPRRANSADA